MPLHIIHPGFSGSLDEQLEYSFTCVNIIRLETIPFQRMHIVRKKRSLLVAHGPGFCERIGYNGIPDFIEGNCSCNSALTTTQLSTVNNFFLICTNGFWTNLQGIATIFMVQAVPIHKALLFLTFC